MTQIKAEVWMWAICACSVWFVYLKAASFAVVSRFLGTFPRSLTSFLRPKVLCVCDVYV